MKLIYGLEDSYLSMSANVNISIATDAVASYDEMGVILSSGLSSPVSIVL